MQQITTSERPVLFSKEMVQAILRGQKTQTRRVIKPQPTFPKMQNVQILDVLLYETMLLSCPYGKIDDCLWVRETWSRDKVSGNWCYLADESHDKLSLMHGWKPSIHMPKEACRLRLQIKKVALQRLQDITPKEAQAEGVSNIQEFQALWESIHGVGSWEINPWLWVIAFSIAG